MTDQPDQRPADESSDAFDESAAAHEPAAAGTPTTPDISRWERLVPRGRRGRIAVAVGSVAAALIVVGSSFSAGFVVGSDNHGPAGKDQHSAEAAHHSDGGDHGQGARHGRVSAGLGRDQGS